jgi:hypothetical protein
MPRIFCDRAYWSVDSTHTIDNFEFDSNFKYSRNWNNIVVDK